MRKKKLRASIIEKKEELVGILDVSDFEIIEDK